MSAQLSCVSDPVKLPIRRGRHPHVPQEHSGEVVGIGKAAALSLIHISFDSCFALSSITLPDSLTSIGDNAFFSCFALSSVSLPNSLTNIGYGTFAYCAALTSVSLPDSLTSIGDDAFACCSTLTSVTLPDSLTSIGDGAFAYCDALTLTVGRDSYARQYAIDNNIPYTYPDANDWLNG